MWSYFFIFDWIKIITIRYAYKVHDQIIYIITLRLKIYTPLLFSLLSMPHNHHHRNHTEVNCMKHRIIDYQIRFLTSNIQYTNVHNSIPYH